MSPYRKNCKPPKPKLMKRLGKWLDKKTDWLMDNIVDVVAIGMGLVLLSALIAAFFCQSEYNSLADQCIKEKNLYSKINECKLNSPESRSHCRKTVEEVYCHKFIKEAQK